MENEKEIEEHGVQGQPDRQLEDAIVPADVSLVTGGTEPQAFSTSGNELQNPQATEKQATNKLSGDIAAEEEYAPSQVDTRGKVLEQSASSPSKVLAGSANLSASGIPSYPALCPTKKSRRACPKAAVVPRVVENPCVLAACTTRVVSVEFAVRSSAACGVYRWTTEASAQVRRSFEESSSGSSMPADEQTMTKSVAAFTGMTPTRASVCVHEANNDVLLPPTDGFDVELHLLRPFLHLQLLDTSPLDDPLLDLNPSNAQDAHQIPFVTALVGPDGLSPDERRLFLLSTGSNKRTLRLTNRMRQIVAWKFTTDGGPFTIENVSVHTHTPAFSDEAQAANTKTIKDYQGQEVTLHPSASADLSLLFCPRFSASTTFSASGSTCASASALSTAVAAMPLPAPCAAVRHSSTSFTFPCYLSSCPPPISFSSRLCLTAVGTTGSPPDASSAGACQTVVLMGRALRPALQLHLPPLSPSSGASAAAAGNPPVVDFGEVALSSPPAALSLELRRTSDVPCQWQLGHVRVVKKKDKKILLQNQNTKNLLSPMELEALQCVDDPRVFAFSCAAGRLTAVAQADGEAVKPKEIPKASRPPATRAATVAAPGTAVGGGSAKGAIPGETEATRRRRVEAGDATRGDGGRRDRKTFAGKSPTTTSSEPPRALSGPSLLRAHRLSILFRPSSSAFFRSKFRLSVSGGDVVEFVAQGTGVSAAV
eukprot:GHVT01082711.1.p1 GENE.GHVT01082711.1~~GHVT01082711.1.p1  ORF type:complete len:710 (-),score=129.71 GHVT01082711.1:1033-3162(-)